MDPITPLEHQIIDALPLGGVVFDVGARYSGFLNYQGEVHYFDPNPAGLATCAANTNSVSYLNAFGLGDVATELPYFPTWESFVDRPGLGRPRGTTMLKLQRGDDYMAERKIAKVDYLKIDTEGYEFRVLRGFGARLADVRYVQFEYGGCWRDSGDSLSNALSYLRRFGFIAFFGINEYDTYRTINDDTYRTINDTYEFMNIFCSRGGTLQ
jgi:FkbM family methyltransferase